MKISIVVSVTAILCLGSLVPINVTHASPTAKHASRSARTGASCPPQGSAKGAKVQALNKLKARTQAPTDADLDPEISLEAMLEPGSDTDRFSSTQAAEITGYVQTVKVGGVETANCGAKDPAHRDTHIELVISPDQSAEIQRVIVEVTPRGRRGMAGTDDWSTDALKAKLLNKWVALQGWMFYDVEHESQAEHTNPGNDRNWRATVWEIHPITSITVLDGPPSN